MRLNWSRQTLIEAFISVLIVFSLAFALERPFNNVQYLRSKILDGKFFLKCNISASDRNFKIIAPSNKLYGFCQKGRLRRWVCSNVNIKPHMESNIITVEINIRISNENCGEWKCIHGGKQDIVNIKSVEKLCNIMRGMWILVLIINIISIRKKLETTSVHKNEIKHFTESINGKWQFGIYITKWDRSLTGYC